MNPPRHTLLLVAVVQNVRCFVCVQGDERGMMPEQKEFNGEC